MSLLLKALKQAETLNADRRSPEAHDEDDGALALETPRPAGPAPSREWVEPPGLLLGSEKRPSESRRTPRLEWPRLSLVPLVALLAAAVAIGYGLYLYLALQPPAPLSPMTGSGGTAPLPETAAPTEIPEHAATSDAPVTAAPQPTHPTAVVGDPPRAAAGTRPVAVPRTSTAAAERQAPPELRADPQTHLLDQAYAAYRHGAFDEAQRLYAEAARRTNSVDALLGLAAVASVQNRDADAQHLYREILALDPNNAAAQAALLDLSAPGDPGAAESRLKAMLERAPAPQLYQTLGNLYAGQGRWTEAQEAYFRAYQGFPDNADYAFNLAVALDQLGQYAAARSYYEKALTHGGAHRFDRAQANARMQQLGPVE